MWICPNCEEEITCLKYEVNTSSYEYGDADLSDHDITDGSDRNKIIDFNCNGCGDNSWDGTPQYTCPLCNDNISLNQIQWVPNDDETLTEKKQEEKKKEKPEEPEETLHNIIKGIDLGGEKGFRHNQTDSIMICKKCIKPFPFETTKNNGNDEYFECPHCGVTNSYKEYRNFLREGKFGRKVKEIRLKEFKPKQIPWTRPKMMEFKLNLKTQMQFANLTPKKKTKSSTF
jgi:hypothetical protein